MGHHGIQSSLQLPHIGEFRGNFPEGRGGKGIGGRWQPLQIRTNQARTRGSHVVGNRGDTEKPRLRSTESWRSLDTVLEESRTRTNRNRMIPQGRSGTEGTGA